MGLIFTTEVHNTEWYRSLKDPSFVPPAMTFVIGWTTGFTALGIGSALMLQEAGGVTQENGIILLLNLLQLLLNGWWNSVLYWTHSLSLGLAYILVIDAVVAVMGVVSWPVHRVFACICLPYFIWCLFATHFVYQLWIVNRVKDSDKKI